MIPDPRPAVRRLLPSLHHDVQNWLADDVLTFSESRRDLSGAVVGRVWSSPAGIVRLLAVCLDQFPEREAVELAWRLWDEHGPEHCQALLVRASGWIDDGPVERETRAYQSMGLVPVAFRKTGAVAHWPEIDRRLAEARNWTPHQIDQMTLPELCVLAPPPELSDMEKVERVRLWKKLTPEAKLLMADAT